jgi:hypothetical protein
MPPVRRPAALEAAVPLHAIGHIPARRAAIDPQAAVLAAVIPEERAAEAVDFSPGKASGVTWIIL